MNEKWIVGFHRYGTDEMLWLMKSGEYWIVTPNQNDAAEFPCLKELHSAVENYVPQEQILKLSGYHAVKLK